LVPRICGIAIQKIAKIIKRRELYCLIKFKYLSEHKVPSELKKTVTSLSTKASGRDSLTELRDGTRVREADLHVSC
jgi:hypothetical protein